VKEKEGDGSVEVPFLDKVQKYIISFPSSIVAFTSTKGIYYFSLIFKG